MKVAMHAYFREGNNAWPINMFRVGHFRLRTNQLLSLLWEYKTL